LCSIAPYFILAIGPLKLKKQMLVSIATKKMDPYKILDASGQGLTPDISK
jgi:hypothetical protein